MFIGHVRSPLLNLRLITLVPKGNKNKRYMNSWRPVSIQSNLGKPWDKIIAYRILAYGIRLNIIKLSILVF